MASKVDKGEMTLEELEERIWLRVIEEGTLLIRGSWFAPNKEQVLEKMFFRGTYAAARGEQIVEAVRRVGAALRQEFGLEGEEGKGVNGHANGHA